MVQFVSQFGSESGSSGIGALGVNGQALLIQLVTFVLAYLVLRRFAFRPILKVLQERRELIESGVSIGEEMQKVRAALDARVTATLHDARQTADGILADAHDAARDAGREVEEKARVKAENIVTEAHSRGEQDKQQMRKQLEQEVVELISDATEVIINEKVDATRDAALIDKALKQQSRGSKGVESQVKNEGQNA